MMRAVVITKGRASAGEGTRIAVQQGLFEAFAELYGGQACNKSISQVLFVDCPDGNAATGKNALNKCDMWSVNGNAGPERMAARLVAAAREHPEGMGLAVLLHALDRLESRYDVYDISEAVLQGGAGASGGEGIGPDGAEAGEEVLDAPVRRMRRSS